ncbi:MAG TPA: HupE/UreJ family protein [Gemmatimonadaceae bacterium]|nr:HupE/UreJ family protein [Gemmatimonadaceae bacterium]
MSELLTFMELGFRHITDVRGLDHVLFLLALAAIYRARDWRNALWVVTAFTVGHSITLALAVTGVILLPSEIIEFLIPVTIVATCIENIVVREREHALWKGHYRPIFAGVFGLVHGAGFANYLRDLFIERVAVPLLGFNLGIEIGQVAVLLVAGAVFLMFDKVLNRFRTFRGFPPPLRLRVLAVSLAVMVVATRWAIARSPW